MSTNKTSSAVIRVLVFPCGAENALELHDALSSCVNIEVWGTSSRSDHGKYVFRNYVGDIPYIQNEGFVTAFNKLLIQHRIDVVFPTHDTVADFLSNRRKEIAARIVVGDAATARVCREKKRTYRVFADCGFAPRVYESLEATDSYPVFLKPNIGEGGKNTRRVGNLKEAHHAIALQPDLLIVEYLPGEELSIDCFTDRHGKLRFIGPRVRNRIFYGISVNSHTVQLTDEIRTIAEQINQRLLFRGLWFFQVKKDSVGNFKLMEVSTRTAGTMCVYRQQGVNLPLLSVYDAMDMDIEINAEDFSVEVDRALINRFRLGIEYDTIYLDLDDTLLVRGRVNRPVLLLLYQAMELRKPVHLLTRHSGDVHQTLADAKIDPSLFASIQKLTWQSEKAHLIQGERPIFIDNAFAERKKVKAKLRIPVFDVDAVPALLDWRT